MLCCSPFTTHEVRQSYILYGVPQGSVIGSILFLLYTADLIKLVKVRDLHPHLYADNAYTASAHRIEPWLSRNE